LRYASRLLLLLCIRHRSTASGGQADLHEQFVKFESLSSLKLLDLSIDLSAPLTFSLSLFKAELASLPSSMSS
jgi:hypothetical protein